MRSGTGSRMAGIVLVLLIVMGGLGFLAVAIEQFGRDGMQFAVMAILGEAALFSMLALGPVGKAIGKLLEGGDADSDAPYLNRLADVEDRLTEISGEVERLAELEARLEFTERLLSAPTDPQIRKE